MWKHILIVLAILTSVVFVIRSDAVLASQSESVISTEDFLDSSPTPEDRQVRLLRERAIGYYEESLSSLDEADILKSIETLDELIIRYPDSIGARDAYFWIADLLARKFQSEDGYKGAIRAYEDYLFRFPWHERAWEAQYSIASIQYLYLKDYTSAQDSIEKLFEDHQQALNSLADNNKAALILYAKIMHKNGELGKEIKALDEIELIDYKIDYEYRTHLNKGIKSNRILKFGPENCQDKFIFMGTFDPNYQVKQLLDRFSDAEEQIKDKLPGLEREFPLQIYVYTDAEYFQSTTGRNGSFGSGADAQIFYLDDQPIEPLFAQIYAFLINNQPSDFRIAFLEIGFLNAFGEIDINIDTAALELGIESDSFTGEILFDNSEFPFISENVSIASAFVNFLLTEYPSDCFYRTFGMMEGSQKVDLKIAGPEGAAFNLDDNRVRPATLLRGFQNVYGVSFDTVADNFLDEMKIRREELDRNLDTYLTKNPVEKFKLNQSTPEDALKSYFTAIKTGRYDDFRKCTTGNLREQLDEAYKIYKDKNLLSKVERWKMMIPYMDVRIDIFSREVVTNSLVIFGVNLLRDGKVMEQKNLVVSENKDKWYISEN